MNDSNVKVNITGATGFVGKNLMQRLHEIGVHTSSFQRVLSDQGCLNEVVVGDLYNLDKFSEFVTNPGIFVHLASVTDPAPKDPKHTAKHILLNSFFPIWAAYLRDFTGLSKKYPMVYLSSLVVFFNGDRWEEDIDENTDLNLKNRDMDTWNFVNSLVDLFKCNLHPDLGIGDLSSVEDGILSIVKNEFQKERSIFSTSRMYPYKISKLVVETMLRDFDSIVIIRPSNVYGPLEINEFRVLPSLLKSVLQGYSGYYPNLVKDFVYIDDLIEVLLNIVNSPHEYLNKNEIFHVSSGVNTKPQEIIDTLETLNEDFIGKIHVTNPQFFLKPPVFKNEKMKKLIQKETTPLVSGLTKYVEWFDEYLFRSADKTRFLL